MNPSEKHADSAFYGIAAKEIQAGNVDVGLMAKAVAKARGNKKEAEVLYLEWRVELLKEEAANEFKKRETEARRREAELKAKKKEKLAKEAEVYFESHDNTKDLPTLFFVVIGIVAIIFSIIILS